MTQAIIFDCFGVLVGAGFWNVYRWLGGDPQKDAAYLDELINKASVNEISREEFRSTIAKHLNISRAEYDAAFAQDEVPNRDVFDFIRSELKGKYKLGLLSNAGAGTVERKIPPDLLQLFDAVVVSGDVGMLKPDPTIFRLAAERLGIKPQNAVFIDDHAGYLPGAQATGMQTVLFTSLDDCKKHLAALGVVLKPKD